MLNKTFATCLAGLALTATAAAAPASAMLPSPSGTGTADRASAPRLVTAAPPVDHSVDRSVDQRGGNDCDNPYPASVVTATTVKLWGRTADYGQDIGAHVKVTAPGSDARIRGTVVVSINGAALADAEVAGSGVFVELPSRLAVGPTHDVTATFRPPNRCSVLQRSTSTVVKFKVVPTPGTVVADVDSIRSGQKALLAVKARTRSGITATGKVTVKVRGPQDRTSRVELKRGRAELALGRFTKPGKYQVTVDYSGARGVKGDRTSTSFKVKR